MTQQVHGPPVPTPAAWAPCGGLIVQIYHDRAALLHCGARFGL